MTQTRLDDFAPIELPPATEDTDDRSENPREQAKRLTDESQMMEYSPVGSADEPNRSRVEVDATNLLRLCQPVIDEPRWGKLHFHHAIPIFKYYPAEMLIRTKVTPIKHTVREGAA